MAEPLTRHSRRTRWYHATVYLITLPLGFTGWWILTGEEGRPSPLARIVDIGDARLHVWLGRALAVIAVLPLLAGRRAIATFLKETFRADRGDAGWFARWPAGILTGRFARHEGDVDPGQRVANIAIVGGLLVLTASGIGLTLVHGGSLFARLDAIHRWATYLVTAAVAGHVIVAFGVLPGYRGVWRSMHLGGRLREDTARRIWPGWTERAVAERPAATNPPEASSPSDLTGPAGG